MEKGEIIMAAYQAIELKDNLWSIEMGYVRAYLAIGDKCAFLFDTGLAGGDIRDCVSGITDKEIVVLNTHCDYDHVGCNDQFDNVYLHPADFYKYFIDGGKTFDSVKPLYEGQIFDNGGFTFEVIYLPGHTPGSVAYLEKNKRFLIGGDMFSIMVYLWGPERNIYAYKYSLNKIEARASEFDYIYAYHGNRLLGPEVIGYFKECVEGILDGSIQGFVDENSGFDTGSAKIYSTGKANILFDPAALNAGE